MNKKIEDGLQIVREILGDAHVDGIKAQCGSGGYFNGLTVKEVEEAPIHSIPYVGFPVFATPISAVVDVLREMGLDLNSKTPEERGLLWRLLLVTVAAGCCD